jgi:transmembrane sensor
MSEPRKSRLPVPLGDVLESGLAPGREERLWATIRARRGMGLGGHSEPPRAGQVLPAPLARVLDDASDLTNKRSRVWRQIEARRKDKRSKSAFRGAFALGFGVAAVASVLLLWQPALLERMQSHEVAARPQQAPAALTLASGKAVHAWDASEREQVVELADASHIRLARGARIEPLLSSGSRFELLLARGEAEFSVTPGGPRRWIIEAGLARVEVVGTQFRVARVAAADGRGEGQVRVSVSHGIVLVRGPSVPGLVQRLTAGQVLEVTPAAPAAPVEAAATPAPAPAAEAVALPEIALSAGPAPRMAKPRAAAPAVWRTHVSEGRFAEAYATLGPARFKQEIAAANSADALLSLADAARLSGHPGDAVAPLERVLDDFTQSPSAALAAFTLGRVQLDQLNAPKQAAAAFERAILMHPPSAILADCHARLVEAYARGGDVAAAQRAAARYRTLFPTGRHNVDLESGKRD